MMLLARAASSPSPHRYGQLKRMQSLHSPSVICVPAAISRPSSRQSLNLSHLVLLRSTTLKHPLCHKNMTTVLTSKISFLRFPMSVRNKPSQIDLLELTLREFDTVC